MEEHEGAPAPAPQIPDAVADGYGPMVRLWIRRALRTDLQPLGLLPGEKVVFEVENLHHGSDVTLRVMAWRRAALFLAMLVLCVPTAIQLIKSLFDLGGGGGMLGALGILVTLSSVALVVGVWTAHRAWEDLRRSRRILFGFWLAALIVPFIACLFPIAAGAQGGHQLGLGLLGSLVALTLLGPKVLALMPGLLRAALAVRVLYPASGVASWLIRLGVPLYLVLVFVVLQAPYQVAGGGFLAIALMAFMAAPIVLWVSQRAAPGAGSGAAEAGELVHAIHRTRVFMVVLNTVGGVFLFVGLIDLVASVPGLGALDAVLPVVATVANALVTSVVALDLTLAHAFAETNS